MSVNTYLLINDVLRESPEGDFYLINELDQIQLTVSGVPRDSSCKVIIEDYEVPCGISYEASGLTLKTERKNYFGECFGFSSIRIFVDGELEETIAFSVAAKKITADQARLMIEYLVNKSSGIIHSLLSRSSVPRGHEPSPISDPEMVLTCVELLVNVIQDNRRELTLNLKERLIPIRIPISDASLGSWEIDPSDVLQNLDLLTPSQAGGEVYVRGRAYDVNNTEVLSLNPTHDVYENRVILGGLYAARRMLLEIESVIDDLPKDDSGVLEGFEGFSRFLLSITADTILSRCVSCRERIKSLIVLFERNLKVTYVGEVVPVITPYVRGVRVYKTIFSAIYDLYGLGKISAGKLRFLMKLKSLSKIYEIYVYFNILEHFHCAGWEMTSVERTTDVDMGQFVPKSVTFSRSSETLEVQYEPLIYRKTELTKHLDLVDIFHKSSSKHPYFNPDFVFKYTVNGELRYLILDAKYSSTRVVREMHVPKLYQKYFQSIAVFDAEVGIVTNAPIVSVLAVYPITEGISRFHSHWSSHGLYSPCPSLPVVGGLPLTTRRDTFFGESLSGVLSLVKRTIRPLPVEI